MLKAQVRYNEKSWSCSTITLQWSGEKKSRSTISRSFVLQHVLHNRWNEKVCPDSPHISHCSNSAHDGISGSHDQVPFQPVGNTCTFLQLSPTVYLLSLALRSLFYPLMQIEWEFCTFLKDNMILSCKKKYLLLHCY